MVRALVICRDAAQATALMAHFDVLHYHTAAPGEPLPADHRHNRVLLMPGWKGGTDESTRDAWVWYRTQVDPRWTDAIRRQVVAL